MTQYDDFTPPMNESIIVNYLSFVTVLNSQLSAS